MKVENAITILDNLYYIEDKDYKNEKLNKLVNYKKELDTNNLLIYDKLFKKILKRRKVVVYGYGLLNTFDTNMFMDAVVIPYKKHDKKYDVYHFVNIKDEVEFVFQRISDLIKNNIDINKISIMNIDLEYIPYLKMMEKFYGIKMNYNNEDNIMGTIIGKKFFALIKENKSSSDIILSLKEYENSKEYSFIINILNKYSNCNLLDYLDEIKYDLLNTKIKNDIYENVVKVKNVFDFINDDEYVFLMNFTSSSIPSLKMDTDYITDDICKLVNVDTKDDENELIKENTITYLSSINNIIISYKDKSPFNEYSPSILLDYINYENKTYERSMSYSNLANQSLYSMYLDDLVKYGIKNKDLDLLYTTYEENNYLEYNNYFKGLDNNKLISYLNNELTLSYTSVDSFYKCGFQYYLNNVLKINIFEETFNTVIGKLFHYCLSKMNENNFDLDREYSKYIKDYNFTNKEKFFIDKLKKDLEYIISVIKKHQFISGFTKMLYEQKVDITLMNNPYVHFKGFVDKIMYKEKNNNTLVSIIDYKTGNSDEVNIKNLRFGLSMQLPIYLYLVSHSKVLQNMQFTGFYLNRILDINVIKKDNKTIDELKYNNLKLDGYSTNIIERLSDFDPTYENSEVIKSMKTNNDGTFSHYAKVLTDEEINEILLLTEEKINEAMNEILGSNFLINPKILKRENVSCKYCDYKDICYYNEKDLVYLDDSGEEEE